MSVIEQAHGRDFAAYNGDCVEIMRDLPADSVHCSVYSPPFASLYTYSDDDRDMGNCANDAEFFEQYNYMIAELYRVMMPGRLVAVHCMNLTTLKSREGWIGMRDFRGDIIRAHEKAGFIFHSEVVIWKDPVVAMQRTKALGLLWKQLRKDSAVSRQGIPDYLVVFGKPGDNPQPIEHTPESFPVDKWQHYASPVWMDIDQTDTLQKESARENEDERHICPLQLGVIRRVLELWSNPGDTVLSPFGGIGSEGYVALEMGRRYIGCELKGSYYRQMVANLQSAGAQVGLFG